MMSRYYIFNYTSLSAMFQPPQDKRPFSVYLVYHLEEKTLCIFFDKGFYNNVSHIFLFVTEQTLVHSSSFCARRGFLPI